MTEKLFIFLFIQLWARILAQHTPYSLQTAVEALHRREAQLALKDNHNFRDGRYGPVDDNEYWDDDPDEYGYSHTGRFKINQILAKQLAREHNNNRNYENDFDDGNYLPDEKKRSFFRERDEKYGGSQQFPSVFRERELEPLKQPELAEEFLREIQKEKELEREEKFRETLRRLWENYQQQENEIRQDLFDGNNEDKRKHVGTGGDNNNGDVIITNGEINPYYVGPPMERKRSYPVLPWLPATKKKRFPVAKRSPKITKDDVSVSGTDEKVAKDLQAIFGHPKDEKKKRSLTADESIKVEQTSQKPVEEVSGDREHMEHGSHYHIHHSKHNEEGDEHEEESDEHDEHDHEHEEEDDDEHDHDFDDDEDEDCKRKREINTMKKKRANLEVVKEDQIIPGDLTDVRGKKSIQWSKYFGIDRRKKSNWLIDENNKLSPLRTVDENDIKKKDIDPEKIENMNNKLKSIEDYIIDETVKYTGAHEGISDPDEIRRLKDHVVSRLATAYNLEKMRLALEKLRQSVDNENHLQRNEIESDYNNNINKKDNEKEKRVAVKKEKAEYDHAQHSMDSSSLSKSENVPSNNLDDKNNNNNDDEKNKKKKKRTGGIQQYMDSSLSSVGNIPQDFGEFEEELGAGHFEPLNDIYLMGGKNYNNNGGSIEDELGQQCPLLDAMTDRCRGVDLLSGDIHQELLPICNIHQLCYLCGTSQVACDFQYLSEADSICGRNNDCQSAARSALMILRGSTGPQLGPKECLKNPCLFKAMKEIGL